MTIEVEANKESLRPAVYTLRDAEFVQITRAAAGLVCVEAPGGFILLISSPCDIVTTLVAMPESRAVGRSFDSPETPEEAGL